MGQGDDPLTFAMLKYHVSESHVICRFSRLSMSWGQKTVAKFGGANKVIPNELYLTLSALAGANESILEMTMLSETELWPIPWALFDIL